MLSERTALVTANALRLPDLMWGMAEGRLSNITSICPPIRSFRAGPDPGRDVGHEDARARLNSSPARWMEVPLPLDAMLSWPGWALA
ncbi:hypothetical protein Y695_04244 [Hydrogenophaga sp. T4]|nr:hypothetical protein Y695_04244 [Hydrogenophaga sp. T4]